MRKIFANLKSVVALAVVAAMTLSVSCMYDDTALTKRVSKVEKDLAALTEKVNGLDTEAVESLINGLTVITGVTTDEAGNTVVTLSNGTSFTVLAECEGLQYRNENGVLEISADGETWVAVTADAACLVKEVRTNADGTATLVLADGTEFTSAVAEVIECAATRTGVYVLPETTKAVRFSINDAVVDITVMNQPLGWTATVEEYVEVEVEEPDYGGGVMPLAAGGKEYVLNITGPAKDFAHAAKEGVVSVHFNTAAGACKVMKVAVTLAELTLEVKDGYVTLTNTVALEQTNRLGDTYTDFADFYIGVIDAEDYAQYGDKVFTETFDDWNYEYLANVNYTKRTAGFMNVVGDELLAIYEEGVCEEESYTISIEDFATMFEPNYTFEAGKEYIIFVTLDGEISNYMYHPVLSTAIKVDYKSVCISAEFVDATPDGAIYDFNLAGYSHFIIGWYYKDMIDEYIQMGVANSFEECLALMAVDMGGIGGLPGYVVEGPVVGEYSLADIAEMGTGWVKEIIESNTEYYFFIYPFNFESEEVLYTPVDPANVYTFGTFTPSEYVPAAEPFEHGFQYEVLNKESGFISIKGNFNENVVAYAFKWYEYQNSDLEYRIHDILENGEFYTTDLGPMEAFHYPNQYPVYLCVVAINANYEYVYFEETFTYEPPQVELASVVAAYQENSPNYYALTFTDVEGNVITTTAGNGGVNYLNAGTWDFQNYYDSGFALGNPYYNGEFAGSITMVVKHVDGQYDLTVTIPQGIYTYVGDIEGMIVPVAEDGGEDGGETGGDDAEWADAIVLTSVAHAGYGGSVGDYDTQFAHHYLLSDESGNNTVKLCSCDYDFSQQVADAGTYTFVNPYTASYANDDAFMFSAYELKVNGVAVELNYDGQGSLVITKTGDYVHTFKFAVPGADGNTYKFVAENVSWNE